MTTDEKTCASCGRRIEWRKKWAKDWDQVRYCSDACRRRKVSAVDRELEAYVLRLLGARPRGATITPADAARAVAADGASADDLADPALRAVRRLVAAGEVEMLQRGRVVDPSTAKGPVQVRRVS